MPSGRWIMWLGGVIHTRPPETQRAVMEVLVSQLGGTAAAVAERLGISARTVEAWRSGKAPLPIKSAYAIGEALATQ
jgi:transcriptional regulator with XRE-family HTH domain